MIPLRRTVDRMAEQRFVQPLQKGLLSDYNVAADVRNVVQDEEPANLSAELESKGNSWWVPLKNVLHRDIKVFESLNTVEETLCSEHALLKCKSRCCMTWTMYDRTSCINSRNTACDSLHQNTLYNQTLKDLGDVVFTMTEWDMHFAMCESFQGSGMSLMHLNSLDSMVDCSNVLVMNPNSFPVLIIL